MAASSALRPYTQLNTVPAIVGIVFAVAAGVQFLDVQLTVGLLDWTFQTGHAVFVGLGALVVVFASSETKDWERYETYEQGAVAIAVVLMLGAEYVTQIADLLANNQPVAGIIAFAIAMVGWGVLAR